jgi:hypothetical protein
VCKGRRSGTRNAVPRGVDRTAALGHSWDALPQDVRKRLEILHFFEKHGFEATLDAFGVSRRTLDRRKAVLLEEKIPTVDE